MKIHILHCMVGNIYENTIFTIKELSAKFDLFIVSNCQSGYIEAFLKYYELQSFFKDYECSGNTNKNKEYNIKLHMKRSDISNSIYIGDTAKDCIAA